MLLSVCVTAACGCSANKQAHDFKLTEEVYWSVQPASYTLELHSIAAAAMLVPAAATVAAANRNLWPWFMNAAPCWLKDFVRCSYSAATATVLQKRASHGDWWIF